jgi:hypothetical protein
MGQNLLMAGKNHSDRHARRPALLKLHGRLIVQGRMHAGPVIDLLYELLDVETQIFKILVGSR